MLDRQPYVIVLRLHFKGVGSPTQLELQANAAHSATSTRPFKYAFANAIKETVMTTKKFLAVSVLYSCAFCQLAHAAVTFTALGDLTGGTFDSIANAVSDNGLVLVGRGQSSSGMEAFRWTSGGGIVGLGDLAGGSFSSQATGVSQDGSVVVGQGTSASGGEAFRWTSGGAMVGLGDLAGGGFGSNATNVSQDGTIVVGQGNSANGAEAFRWTNGGGMVGLGDLAGGSFSSNAYALSADGSVIVGQGTSASGLEAFRWTSGGGMIGLGDLAGGSFSSYAHDVSGDGAVVVGQGSSASGSEAFRWTSSGGMVGLGDLAGGSFSSAALAVTNDGSTIVGVGNSASGFVAMIWDVNGGMQSLQDVLASEYSISLPSWTLRNAYGISGDGRVIVGYGVNPSAQNEAFKVDFTGAITARWGASASGNWGTNANWRWSLGPRSIDSVEITPASGLVVNGPTTGTTVATLVVGATTSGVAELQAQADLTATNGVTIETAGRIALSGQVLDSGTGLIINGGGTVQGNGLIIGPISGSSGLAGIVPTTSYVRTTPLAVGGNTVRVVSVGFANLGPDVALTGGTIHAPRGVFLQGASNFSGNGTVNGKVAASFGSTVTATGSLTLGDANSVSGFTSDGELCTGANTVTINDANDAVLGSLTTLGDGVNDGTLVAGTAVPLETRTHFLIEQGKNLVGRGHVVGNVKNHGSVTGDGPSLLPNERIIFDTGWRVSGIGDFANVLFNGTFAPGLSPGVVAGSDLAIGGTLEIELGGATAGNGIGHHDQVNDASVFTIAAGAALALQPYGGYLPTLGQEFTVVTAAAGIAGEFASVTVDPWFWQHGIDFQLSTTSSALVITAVAPHLSGDFNLDGSVDAADYTVWRHGLGTTYSQADLADWRANFGKSFSAGSAFDHAAVPEPSVMAAALLAIAGFASQRRRIEYRGISHSARSIAALLGLWLVSGPATRADIYVGPTETLQTSIESGSIVNHGLAVGTVDEPLVFGRETRVQGSGEFVGTLSLGVFAPGNSPGITTGTNQAFGASSIIEIELGGTLPGLNANNHDQLSTVRLEVE